MSTADELLIGAHTSIAGGVHKALLEGASMGATTVQFFTANQKQWKKKVFSEQEVEIFQHTLQETKLQKIMSHAGYLINLGSPSSELRAKSHKAFVEEIERCLALGLTFLNFHPGSSLQEDRNVSIDHICKNIISTSDYFVDNSLRLLLETTAGQGSSIGFRFEELAYILEKTHKHVPIGICIDTCHIFAAGYDIRTFEAWKATLKEFDTIIGLNHLYAFHLNDSIGALGSRKDRHASLGEGEIGLTSFEFLMRDHTTRNLPKYLETPEGKERWDKEIWLLREFARKPLLYAHKH